MGPSPGHRLLSLHRRVDIILWRTKQLKFFCVKTNLLKHGNGKHLEYSIGSPTFFEWKCVEPLNQWLSTFFMRRPTLQPKNKRLILQPNDLLPKIPVKHMKFSCVCTIKNHNDYKITYDITVWNQGSWQHQWERPVPYTNHSTAQLIEYQNKNSLISRNQTSNLQTHHILNVTKFFVRCQTQQYSLLWWS